MTTHRSVAPIHASLAAGRWFELDIVEQMANIGAEVGRARRAMDSGDSERFARARARCLELFDLTLADQRWLDGRDKEVRLAREEVCDLLSGERTYHSDPALVDRYFLSFALLANARRRMARRPKSAGAGS
ncbi:MAG TPA: hypothetical protein VFW92_06500 [Candidatus Limnocylindrales bacterium]|nr:hypothetical protein [Candidatus Limnocylindrales bacterium]